MVPIGFLLVLSSTCSLVFSALVYTLTTDFTNPYETSHTGSVAGGTMLFVDGTNLMTNDPTQVQIFVGGQECLFDSHLMRESYIECTVPVPANLNNVTNLPITVWYQGSPVSISPSANPVFSYVWSKTGIIYAVCPAQQSAFHDISFYGTWQTSGDNSLYQEIRVAYRHVATIDDYSTFQSYGTTFIAVSLGDNVAEEETPTVRLAASFGDSLYAWTAKQYTLEGDPYYFKAIAEVDSVSFHSGSTAGGLTLTVSGAGFPTNLTVTATVSGNPCDITSISFDTIVCVTTPQTLTEAGPTYEGGAGLRHHFWYLQTISNAAKLMDKDADIADIVPMAEAFPPNNLRIDDYYVERWVGFFKAPRTGNYTFYTSSDDGCQVYIAPGKDPSGKVKVIDFGSYTNFRDMLTRTSTRTSPILMTEGELHYIEIWHQQWGGAEHFSLGVQIPPPPSGNATNNNMPSLQLLTIQPTQLLREVQRITISGTPTGGKIAFSYKGVSSPQVSWPTSGKAWTCSDILTAMQKLSIPSVGCAANTTAGLTYDFTFNYAWTDIRGFIQADMSAATPAGLSASVLQVQKASIPLGGTYQLMWQNVVTGNIPVTTSASTLQSQLNANFTAFNNKLLVFGSANVDSVQIQFLFGDSLNPTGSVPLIIVVSSVTGGPDGTEPIANVTESIPASKNQFWWATPSEFFRTIESYPVLQVQVETHPAICRGNCAFQYLVASPNITSVTYGPTVSMIGVNLPGSLACDMVSVSIGGADCPLVNSTSCSITSIECNQEVGVVGTFKPAVMISGSGLAVLDPAVTSITYSLTITSVSPTSGSIGGGTLLSIVGTGFLPVMHYQYYVQEVLVGDSVCDVQTTSGSLITCITAPQTTDNTTTVSVNSTKATSTGFVYDPLLSPTITNVAPTYASTIVKTVLTITGTNFDTSAPGSVTVFIGDVECYVTASTATTVTCDLPGGPTGKWLMVVSVPGKGNAVYQHFPLVFDLTSVSPSQGSKFGGTLLTLIGHGLSTRASQLLVMISDEYHICAIEGIPTENQVKCRTPPMSPLAADTPQSTLLIGRIQEVANCTGACNFTYSTTLTPSISSLSVYSGPAGTAVNIIGTGFGSNPSLTTVLFGAQTAIILSVSSTLVSVTVPNQQAGTFNVTVTFDDIGTAAGHFTFNQTVAVSSVSPLTGSQAGTQIVILGTGFASNSVVTFGAAACNGAIITTTKIMCRLASGTSTTVQMLTIAPSPSSYTCTSAGLCGFTYVTSANTPKITAATVSGNTVSITGSGFSTTASNNQVSIGGVLCSSVTAATAISITSTCTPPSGPAAVQVFVQNVGYASGNVSINTVFTASGATGTGSYGGGSNLMLTGSGLGPNTTVAVCGFPCSILTATYSALSCSTPTLPSDYSQPIYNLIPITNPVTTNFTGSTPSSSSHPLNAVFDSNYTTYYMSYGLPCSIQLDSGAGHQLLLGEIDIYPAEDSIRTYRTMVGTNVTMSNDTVTWTPVHTFTVTYAGWNYWNVPRNQDPADNYPVFKARYFLLSFPAASNCRVAELRVYGIVTQTGSSDPLTCTVTAQDGVTGSTVNAGSFLYASASTPTVTSISPTTGTTLGGTHVTFGGAQLTSVSQLSINGIPCPVSTTSATSFTCITGPSTSLVTPSILITTSTGLAVIEGVSFLYADRWSASTTWGGEVPPKAGESVHIPVGQTILLDVATPVLDLILIEGSLIVADVAGITLEANYIFINRGLFQVGTEAAPFQNVFTLVMHGLRESPMIPIYGNKVMGVYCGVLDMHGVPRNVTWTSLATTVMPKDTTFTLQQATDWAVGETVVVASTSYDHTEAETRVITSVLYGTQYTVNLPFAYKHYAATETYGSNTIDMRAEVGLLSRNIKIRGSDQGLSQQHGVHVMAYAPGDDGVTARISYVEIYNAGQAYSVGAYPFHFHMIGSVRNSYIIGNAVHDTFNRAVTIHGISYLRVINNVCYNTMGHTIFLEDGIETKNRIMNNLVVSVFRSWSRLNTDTTPAGIWVTNPDNYIIGNHVAGSDAYGIWVDLHPNPTGPSATTLICPFGVPLAEFSNNVVHSNIKYGFRIFHMHIPLEFPCNPSTNSSAIDPWADNPPVTAIYWNLTSYKNQLNGAIAERIGDVRFVNFKVADNMKAGIEMTYTLDTPPYTIVFLSNALIIGRSQNAQWEVDLSGCIGLITPQSDGFLAQNVAFYNFDNTMFTLGDMSHSQSCLTHDIGGRRAQLQGLTFGNATKLIHWEVPQRSFFQILDASMTGTAGAYIAAFWPHLLWEPYCVLDLATYNGIVCDGTKQMRRVHLLNLQPSNTFFLMQVTVRRAAGENIPVTNTSATRFLQNPSTDYWWTSMPPMNGAQYHNIPKSWAIPMINGTEYYVHWGTTPMDWTFMNINIDSFDDPSLSILVRFNFTDHRENFLVNRGTIPAGVNTSAPGFVDPTLLPSQVPLTPTSPAGASTFDNVTAMEFDVMLTGQSVPLQNSGPLTVTAYRCWGGHCTLRTIPENVTMETFSRVWSNNDSWPSGVVPVDGDSVVILPNWTMILDTDTAILSFLEVDGILIFDNTTSVTLNSYMTHVRRGQIISGSANYPLLPNITHRIVVHGNFTSTPYAFDPNIEVVNKAFVVTGQMSMFGAPRKSWVHLVQNANPGDTFIFVERVNWQAGDEIVLTSSSFFQNETDTAIISSIRGSINLVTGVDDQVDLSSDPDWTKKEAAKAFGKYSYQATATNYTSVSGRVVSKVLLTQPLQYYHAGTVLDIGVSSMKMDMRAEVGVLTSNILISGTYNGWACNFVVADFVDYNVQNSNPILRSGNVTLNSIAIDYCGQNSTERTGLRFESTTLPSVFSNSIIKRSQTYSVNIQNSKNIKLLGNTFFQAVRFGVLIQNSNNLLLDGNLMVNVTQRPTINIQFDKPTGFVVCPGSRASCTNVVLARNVAAGYAMIGFADGGWPCGGTPTFYDNVAHSGIAGWITSDIGGGCMQMDGFTAYFIQETAVIGSADTPGLFLSNLRVAESFNGYGGNLGGEADYGNVVSVKNSLFIGVTEHTKCDPTQCWTPACGNRRGILFGVFLISATQWTINGKLHLPVYNVTQDAAFDARFVYDNITFMNYNSTGVCQANITAIASNELSPDFTPIQIFSNVHLINVDPESIFHMSDPDPNWQNLIFCGQFPCTGLQNVVVKDLDGSLVGSDMGGYLFPNNPGIVIKDMCTFMNRSNGYLCNKTQIYDYDYGILMFEDLDIDARDVTISPIYITSNDSVLNPASDHFYNKLNSFLAHVWDGFYVGTNRMTRFPTAIGLNRSFNITYTATLPVKMRYKLQGSDDPTDGVLITIPYRQPYSVLATVNGTSVPGLPYGQSVNMSSPSGTNQWMFQQCFMQFMIRPYDIVELTKVDSIQLTVQMNMTTEQFFSTNGPTEFIDRLAAVLHIPSYRIRVVDVKSGSTICTSWLDSDPLLSGQSATNGSFANAQQQELASLVNTIKSMAANGTLVLNAPVLSVNVTVVTGSSDTTANSTNNSTTVVTPGGTPLPAFNSTSFSNQGSNDGMLTWWEYLLISLAIVVGLGLIALMIVIKYYRLKKKKHIQPRAFMEAQEHEEEVQFKGGEKGGKNFDEMISAPGSKD